MLHRDKLKKYNPYIFNLWYERTPLKWASLCDWDKSLTSLEPMSPYSRGQKIYSHTRHYWTVFRKEKKNHDMPTSDHVEWQEQVQKPLPSSYYTHLEDNNVRYRRHIYTEQTQIKIMSRPVLLCCNFFFLKKAHQLNFPKRICLCDFSNQDTSCAQYKKVVLSTIACCIY